MAGKVRVDLHFTGDRLPVAEVVRLARMAEDAGLGGVWHAEAFHDSLVPLTAVACATRAIPLGTNVTQWSRTLPNLELAAADLQEISGGRFTLGLGTGVREWNEDWHGIPYARQVRRMREYVQGLRVLWTGSLERPVHFEGEIFRVRNYVRFNGPALRPPPIHLAASLPGMATLAGEVADGVHYNAVHSVKYLREVMLPALARGAQEAGRAAAGLARATLLIAGVAAKRAEGIEIARHQVGYFLGVAPYFEPVLRLHGYEREYATVRQRFAAGDVPGGIAAVTDDMVATFALGGTPDDVRRQVARYDGLLDYVMLFAPSFGYEPAQAIAHHEAVIAAFAR